MDTAKIEKLSQALVRLRQEVSSLRDELEGFPALECNIRRVEASLGIMAVELGESSADPEALS
ncbi:MAG: hypothetical protein PVG60_03305 [Desulfarculaceae bacterium]